MPIDPQLRTKANDAWRQLTDAANASPTCSGSGCSCDIHKHLKIFSNVVEVAETVPRRIADLERAATDGLQTALNGGWEKVLEA